METNSHDERDTIRAIQEIPKQLARIADQLEPIKVASAIIAEQLKRLADDEDELREGLK